MNTTLTATRQAAEATYAADPTHANLKALQAAGKAEMDAVVARIDARQAATEAPATEAPAAPAPTATRKAHHTTVPAAPIVYRTALRRRHAAEMEEARALMAARPAITVTPEMEAAYSKYVDEGISATDGYYAPIGRDAFFRLYYSN